MTQTSAEPNTPPITPIISAATYHHFPEMSKQMLINELIDDGFDASDAHRYANELDVDWVDHAKYVITEVWLPDMLGSKKTLLDFLTQEDDIQPCLSLLFTPDEALSAINAVDIDWIDKAVGLANCALNEEFGVSYEALLAHLTIGDYDFSLDDAKAAIDHLNVDWQCQALKQATTYLPTFGACADKLLKALANDGVEDHTARAAIDALNLNEIQRAMAAAQGYLQKQGLSEDRLNDYLILKAGFKADIAKNAVAALNLDWLSEAKRAARYHLARYPQTSRSLIDCLEGFERFDMRLAIIAVNSLNLD